MLFCRNTGIRDSAHGSALATRAEDPIPHAEQSKGGRKPAGLAGYVSESSSGCNISQSKTDKSSQSSDFHVEADQQMGSGRKSPCGDAITPMPRCILKIVFAAFAGASDISHCQGGDKSLKGHSSCPVQHLLCSQWPPFSLLFTARIHGSCVFLCSSCLSVCLSKARCCVAAAHLLCAPPAEGSTALSHCCLPSPQGS